MSGAVQGAANRADVGDDPGGSLVVQHQDSLDPAIFIRAQTFFDLFGGHRGPIGNFNPLYFDSVGARGVTEARAEVAVDAAQHPVARRERIDEARFPGARAGARIQNNFATRGLKYFLKTFQDLFEQVGELRPPMIDERLRHGTHNPVGNQRRTGNL